jgi:acyl-CoA thioester hydrolase
MTPSPQSGTVDERAHYFPVRVYYEDTDAGGIVYHAAYLHFAERARTESLRLLGWTHERTAHEYGGAWAVRRLEADYRRPARLDDLLTIQTRVAELIGPSVRLSQSISRNGQDLVGVRLQLVLVGPSGRPLRLPRAIGAALETLMS